MVQCSIFRLEGFSEETTHTREIWRNTTSYDFFCAMNTRLRKVRDTAGENHSIPGSGIRLDNPLRNDKDFCVRGNLSDAFLTVSEELKKTRDERRKKTLRILVILQKISPHVAAFDSLELIGSAIGMTLRKSETFTYEAYRMLLNSANVFTQSEPRSNSIRRFLHELDVQFFLCSFWRGRRGPNSAEGRRPVHPDSLIQM